MEFKFRAVDDRPPPYLSPSSSSKRYLRAGFSSGLPGLNTDRRPNLNVARQVLQRELEKEQIRREILSTEVAPDIARRRMLETEVIRDLIMERELAIQRNFVERFSFPGRVAMHLHPRLHMHLNQELPMMHSIDNRPLQDPIAFPCSSTFNMFPVPQPQQIMAPEIKQPPETNKDKLIILPKPDPDSYRAKRKAVTPPAVDGTENSVFGLKKPKVEWSCALCQVSATSERGLNEHLSGRRHKAKEVALKIGKSTCTSFSSKKSQNSVKPTVANVSGLEAKSEGQSLQPAKVACKGINVVNHKDLKELKKEEQLPQEQQKTEILEQNETPTEQVGGTNMLKREKYIRFWCDMCQVETTSQIVMEGHMKGRKHMYKMKKINRNHGSVPPTPSNLSSETTPWTKDTAAVSMETHQKISCVLSQDPSRKMAGIFIDSDESIVSSG